MGGGLIIINLLYKVLYRQMGSGHSYLQNLYQPGVVIVPYPNVDMLTGQPTWISDQISLHNQKIGEASLNIQKMKTQPIMQDCKCETTQWGSLNTQITPQGMMNYALPDASHLQNQCCFLKHIFRRPAPPPQAPPPPPPPPAPTPPPQIIEKIVEKPVEKIVEVEKPVQVIYKDRIVYKDKNLVMPNVYSIHDSIHGNILVQEDDTYKDSDDFEGGKRVFVDAFRKVPDSWVKVHTTHTPYGMAAYIINNKSRRDEADEDGFSRRRYRRSHGDGEDESESFGRNRYRRSRFTNNDDFYLQILALTL
jgi:hypothetical protein